MTDKLDLLAFCDESSDGKSGRTIVLAGYVGTKDHWKKFDESWKKVLSQHGVVVFHSVDCEAGKKSFKHIHSNKRSALQRELIDAINSSGITGTTVGMIVEDYYAVSELREFEKIPNGLGISGNLSDPYFLPFKLLIEQIVLKSPAVTTNDEIKIEFTFDRNNKVQGRAQGMYQDFFKWNRPWTKKLDPEGMKFADKSDEPALQAADFLAYESFRWLDESHRKRKPERWQWRLIKESLNPQRMCLLDTESLKSFTDSVAHDYSERMLQISRRVLIDVIPARARSFGGSLVKRGIELTVCEAVADVVNHVERDPARVYRVLAHVDLAKELIDQVVNKEHVQTIFYSTDPANQKDNVLLLPRDLDLAAKFLE